MSEIFQENTESNNKIAIINKYNSLIEKTKGMLFSGLGYNQTGELFYNKAYFSNGQKISKEYIYSQIEEGEKIIQELYIINKEVETEEILNNAQKRLIKERIERNIHGIKYHQNAIYIEAEKGGYPLSNKEKIEYRKEIIKIEDILYGPDITQREDRKEGVVNQLHTLYTKNNQELTETEKHIWEEKILKTFPKGNEENKKKAETTSEKDIYIDEKHIFEMVSLLLEIEGFKKEDIIRIQITNTTEEKQEVEEKDGIFYIPSTRKEKEMYEYFNKKGIGQKFKIIKKDKGNNSVSISKEDTAFKKNQISISPPEKNGKYNITKKVLPIIYDHEISTHVNTGIGNFKNLYISDPERGDVEEGIATFNQKMTENKDIQELYETSIGDIGMFLGENFNEEETKQLLTIYFKLTKEKGQDIEGRAKRIKMGVPIGEKGSKRKDLSYGNGKEIIKELEALTKTPEGIETLNKYAKTIYSTKLGYEGIKDIDNILEGIKDLNELEPNFPIFAGKILYWKIFKGKLDKEKMLENDLRRYIITDKKITEQQKRLLVKILKIIKENKEQDNISLESPLQIT